MIAGYPLTMGTDVAGVVTEVGEGVDHVKVGDAVAGYTAINRPDFGGFAEYCKMMGKLAIPKPPTMSFDDASTLGVSCTTALTSLFSNEALNLATMGTGEWVVVLGGSSSVGQMAIQLLASSGYQVATTASPRNFDWLKSLGAKVCVDYHSSEAAVELKAATTEGSGLKYALDCADAIAQAGSFLQPNARLVSIASFSVPDGVTLPDGVTFSFNGLLAGIHQDQTNLDLCNDIIRNFIAPKLHDASFKPNPIEVIPASGLPKDVVLNTIRRLAETGVSAKTLVLHIDD